MSTETTADRRELAIERDIRASGNSLVVTLPPSVLQAAGREEGDTITVAVELGSDTIELRGSEE